MNPRIARNGLSFKGAWQYYMHDPKAETRNRIEWAETYNTITEDVDKAWKVMAYTAMHSDRLKEAAGRKSSGRKDTRPVMAYSLAWHPDYDPGRDHMREVAIQSIRALGMEEYEAFIVAHRDTPQKHVHVIINRIHPQTGLVASNSYTKRKLSEFSRIYQKEHNMSHLTPQREENYQKRQEGKNAKYRDPKIQKAWDLSDSGKSFAKALEDNGYTLAQGRKRLVVVDPYGKVSNPIKSIEGIKARNFSERIADIDRSALRDADEVAREAQEKHEAKKAAYQKENLPKAKEDFIQTSKLAKAEQGEELTGSLEEEFNAQTLSKSTRTELVLGSQDKHSQVLGEAFNEKAMSEATKTNLAIDNQAPARDREISRNLNRLQNMHLSEQATLSRHFHRRIAKEKDTLGTYYKLRERSEEIQRLSEKCESPSIWRKLFGLTRKDAKKLKALKLGFQNAKTRYKERIGALENEYTEKMIDLKDRQASERAQAYELLQGPLAKKCQTSKRSPSVYQKRPGPSMGPGR